MRNSRTSRDLCRYFHLPNSSFLLPFICLEEKIQAKHPSSRHNGPLHPRPQTKHDTSPIPITHLETCRHGSDPHGLSIPSGSPSRNTNCTGPLNFHTLEKIRTPEPESSKNGIVECPRRHELPIGASRRGRGSECLGKEGRGHGKRKGDNG